VPLGLPTHSFYLELALIAVKMLRADNAIFVPPGVVVVLPNLIATVCEKDVVDSECSNATNQRNKR